MFMHQAQSVTLSEPITHNTITLRDVYNPFDQSCSASSENRCFFINTYQQDDLYVSQAMLNLWLNPDCKGGLRPAAQSMQSQVAAAELLPLQGLGSCSCLSKLGLKSSNASIERS